MHQHMTKVGFSNIAHAHDDVIKWKHFPRNWPFVWGIHRSTVNSPHKCQWRGALMFSLICVWMNGWVNNRETSDLRRHHAHYNVIVMWYRPCRRIQPPSFRHETSPVCLIFHVFSYMYWTAIHMEIHKSFIDIHGWITDLQYWTYLWITIFKLWRSPSEASPYFDLWISIFL